MEGKKTVSFEICEQLAMRLETKEEEEVLFHTPDRVFVSVGDGNIISGVFKGFQDLMRCGFISKMPKIVGVQAAGSNAIASAFASGVSTLSGESQCKEEREREKKRE